LIQVWDPAGASTLHYACPGVDEIGRSSECWEDEAEAVSISVSAPLYISFKFSLLLQQGQRPPAEQVVQEDIV
jgi:hypothetical protein